MLRKLLILGAIAALFTIVTAVPASAIAVDTGQGPLDALDPAGPHDAHGPSCGTLGETEDVGCVHHDGSLAANTNTSDVPGLGGRNFGAWNAVFGPGGVSNLNSAICGITTIHADNTCEVLP
jgi:hypothetical protein